MTEQAQMLEKQSLDRWQPGLFRLSVFPSPVAQIGEPTWWSDLVGEQPEKRTSQPRTGGFRDEGEYEGNKLVLSVQPLRIDWMLVPQEDVPPTANFLTLGTFSECLPKFSRLMNRWFQMEECPTVQRLAFGAVVFLPVESLQIGYQQLSAYLPFEMDWTNATDFNYQINRRRDSVSEIPDLKINRLSKWSVGSVILSDITLAPGSTRANALQHLYGCRLELDINTSPEFLGEITREQLPQIFQELTDLGTEIVEQGDIP